jgi:hypothetical protein
MIGNKKGSIPQYTAVYQNKKGGVFGLLILFIVILIMFFAAFWTFEEIKYSWKINKEINDNNATCYLERGLFKFPLARICTYNNTFIVEKEDLRAEED